MPRRSARCRTDWTCSSGLQVLRHQLEAVSATGHLVGFIRVDCGDAFVAAEGPVTGAVVDDALPWRVEEQLGLVY